MQKKKHTAMPSTGEYAGDLTGKSAKWFRFQDAEQKVKRLGFLLQQESSLAMIGNPLSIEVSIG